MGYVAPDQMLKVTSDLLEGGVGVLQLRAKGYSAHEVVELVQKNALGISNICNDHHVPLIVNDYPEVALEIGADGVHIGQDDGKLENVRSVIGEELLIGRSTHSQEQANVALEEGFDYIGYGPLFPTPTKEGRPGIGIENVRLVQDQMGKAIPTFCIGGIKLENLDLVLASGAQRVVIVSALLQSANIQRAVKEVVSKLESTQ